MSEDSSEAIELDASTSAELDLIARKLGRITLDGLGPLRALMPRMQGLLGARAVFLFSLAADERGQMKAENVLSSGSSMLPDRILETFNVIFAAGNGSGFGTFDPRWVPKEQRNQPMLSTLAGLVGGESIRSWAEPGTPVGTMAEPSRQMLSKALEGSDGAWSYTARVLLCDGGLPLGLLCSFHVARPTERQREVLTRLVGPVVQALRLDRSLKLTSSGQLLVEGALEALAAPAYLVRASGEIVGVNEPGCEAIDRLGPAHRERIGQAVRAFAEGLSPEGDHPRITVSPMRGRTGADLYLAIENLPRPAPSFRVEDLVERLELTDRQAEVLRHVLKGESNRSIARTMHVAERTVEFHFSAVLQKAGVESRAAFLAQLLTDPEGECAAQSSEPTAKGGHSATPSPLEGGAKLPDPPAQTDS